MWGEWQIWYRCGTSDKSGTDVLGRVTNEIWNSRRVTNQIPMWHEWKISCGCGSSDQSGPLWDEWQISMWGRSTNKMPIWDEWQSDTDVERVTNRVPKWDVEWQIDTADTDVGKLTNQYRFQMYEWQTCVPWDEWQSRYRFWYVRVTNLVLTFRPVTHRGTNFRRTSDKQRIPTDWEHASDIRVFVV